MGFFAKKDHGQPTDRNAQGKTDFQTIWRGCEQTAHQCAVGHLSEHRNQVHRLFQAVQADPVLGVGHDPGGAP